jgi:hypothetical protein
LRRWGLVPKMMCPVKKTEIYVPEDCGDCSYLLRSPYFEGAMCTHSETNMPPLCVVGVSKSVNILKKAYRNIRRWQKEARERKEKIKSKER